MNGSDGLHQGFLGLAIDVTERRRAQRPLEAASHDNEVLLRTLDVHSLVSMTDTSGRIILVNDRFCRTSGYSREELLGQNHQLISSGQQADGLLGEHVATFEYLAREGAARGQYLAAIGREEAWIAERLAIHLRGDSTLIQKIDSGRTLRIVDRRMADGHTVRFRIDITEIVRARELSELIGCYPICR